MNLWQNFVTYALVALAAVYVLRYLWRAARRKMAGRCSACARCPAALAAPPVVPLTPPNDVQK
jgi:hypothetical protein